MANHTIILTGPKGAGKTTALNSLGQAMLFQRKINVPSLSEGQPDTTLSLEHAEIQIGINHDIKLYATPSLDGANYALDNVVQDGAGLLLLIDNSRPDPVSDLWAYLETFKLFIANTEVAIGVTKMDTNKKPTIADYHLQLQNSALRPPIFTVDARNKTDVSLLIEALLVSLDPSGW